MESVVEERENSTAKNSVQSSIHKQEEAVVLEQEQVVVEEQGDDVADLVGCISLHKKSSLPLHGGTLSLCVCVMIASWLNGFHIDLSKKDMNFIKILVSWLFDPALGLFSWKPW